MTTIYTNASFEWDGVAEQYVLKAPQGFEYSGPVVLMKKKLKGTFGKILAVVAAVFMPVAVPALAASLGVSTWAAGALYGAGVGAITGGAKGALMGGVLGGISGYGMEQGWFGGGGGSNLGIGGGEGAASGASGSAGLSTSVPGYTPGVGVTAPSVGTDAMSATVGGAGDLAVAADSFAGAASTVNPSGVVLDTGMSSVPGSRMLGSFDAGTLAQGDMSLAPGYMSANGNVGFSYPGADIPTNTIDLENGVDAQERNPQHAAAGPQQPGILDNLDWKGAGLKLGAQALGSAMGPQGPDMDQYNSYLESLTNANKDTLEFNKTMANKKAAVGDNLVTNANAMNPDYFGMQEFNRTRNRDNSAKLDAIGRMRASGMSEQAIQSEMNKYDIGASQNAASAYDTGWQRGLSAQNSTYGTAGGMYGQISQPGDTVGASYSTAYNTAKQGQQAIGGAIEQAFQPVTKNTTTGTQKTRDQDLYGKPY